MTAKQRQTEPCGVFSPRAQTRILTEDAAGVKRSLFCCACPTKRSLAPSPRKDTEAHPVPTLRRKEKRKAWEQNATWWALKRRVEPYRPSASLTVRSSSPQLCYSHSFLRLADCCLPPRRALELWLCRRHDNYLAPLLVIRWTTAVGKMGQFGLHSGPQHFPAGTGG